MDHSVCGICFHQQRDIFVLAETFLNFHALDTIRFSFACHEVYITAVASSLADPEFFIWILAFKVCLNNVHAFAIRDPLKCLKLRTGDEVLAFNFHGSGFSEERRNFFDQPEHLFLKIGGVVDDSVMRMACPGSNQLIIQRRGFFRGFSSCLIVGQRIILFRSFCGGNQMKNSIILIPERNFAGIDLIYNPFKFFFCHICAAVHGAAVAYDKDFILLHQFSDFRECFFLRLLKQEHLQLQIAHGGAKPEIGPAANQLGCGFVHKQHGVPHFCKRILDPAHGSCFAGAGSACDDNFADLFFVISQIKKLFR